MGAQVTYPNTNNDWHDTAAITLQKILQKTSATGATPGTNTLLHGTGDPVAAPDDVANIALYVDDVNHEFWIWEPAAAAWQSYIEL